MNAGLLRVVKQPLAWGAVIAGAVLAGLMTFAYIGAFVDPVGELDGLRVGYVDLDRPVEAAGQQVAVGVGVVDALESAASDGTDAISWIEYRSREEAVADVMDNALAGVVVLPEQLSRHVADIGMTLGDAPPAVIEVITNPGSGALQPSVMESASNRLLERVNTQVSTMLTGSIGSLDISIDPANVESLATPIATNATQIPGLGSAGGRGLPPFYIAVMTTLSGLMGAIAIHVSIGALAGREHLEVLGRDLHLAELELTPLRRFGAEAAFIVPMSALSAVTICLVAVRMLGAEADQPWSMVPICLLGAATIGWLTLLCVTAFGALGEVLVVLVTTIFGVPSARGVYPAEAIPSFFEAIGTFLPLRYLTDTLRSVMYFEGRGAAGLTIGLLALAIWAFGSLLLGYGAAALVTKRRADTTTAPV